MAYRASGALSPDRTPIKTSVSRQPTKFIATLAGQGSEAIHSCARRIDLTSAPKQLFSLKPCGGAKSLLAQLFSLSNEAHF